MNRLFLALVVSGLTVMLTLGTLWTPPAQADSKNKHFILEVAMGDVASGINAPDIPSNMPGARGTLVLASGYIFPAGTLPEGASLFDPRNPDGAIGIWHCQFVSLGPEDFAAFGTTGAVTYFFLLYGTGKGPAESVIMVQGLNSHPGGPMPDVDNSEPRVHAVVGGTGKYANVTGEVLERVIGTNTNPEPDPDAIGRNLRFEFQLEGVRGNARRKNRHDWD